MVLHLRNIKELSSPRGQPTEQTKTQQTTKKGRTDGADEGAAVLLLRALPTAAYHPTPGGYKAQV